MSTKITPAPKKKKNAVTTERSQPLPSELRMPSKRISALTSKDVSKFVVNSINVSADTTAAYVNELKLVQEAEIISEARHRVASTAVVVNSLKLASEEAGSSTEITISSVELQTILQSLEDYQKIKVLIQFT